MKKIILIGLVIASTFPLYSQRDPKNVWNWPEDRATAEEKNVYYTDNMKAELFEDAVEPLEWLLAEAPNLNPSLYINGAKIYEALANGQDDEDQKTGFQEKALEMYDLRVKYFGNEGEALNRKAYTAYKFYKAKRPKYAELKSMFDRAFELNGLDVYDNNLIAYMDVVRRYKLAGGDIADDEVLDIYTLISDIIDNKLKKGGSQERLGQISDNVDKVLAATITVDCAFVESNLGPKLEADPSDVKLAKKIFQLMLTGKCTDSPLAQKAAEIVNKIEPSFGLAKFVASRSQVDGNVEKATEFYLQAADLAESPSKRGEIYLDMAKLYASKNKTRSRDYAYKALKDNTSLRDAYSLIGNLYFSSYESCRAGESRVQDRAIFLAAYEMYSKAGDTKGMQSAKAQFPSMEEIFNEGKEIGDAVTVGCWVNETVQLDRRPAN